MVTHCRSNKLERLAPRCVLVHRRYKRVEKVLNVFVQDEERVRSCVAAAGRPERAQHRRCTVWRGRELSKELVGRLILFLVGRGHADEISERLERPGRPRGHHHAEAQFTMVVGGVAVGGPWLVNGGDRAQASCNEKSWLQLTNSAGMYCLI